MTDSQAVAGWYPDGTGLLRWWDGAVWTDRTREVEVGAQDFTEPTSVQAERSVKSGGGKLKKVAVYAQKKATEAGEWATEAQENQARGSKDQSVLYRGQVAMGTAVTIYKDGTFTVTLGRTEGPKDRLMGVEHGNDSMRRKSVTGRGVAALATQGFTLIANNNNRGVVYLRLVGETTGLHSWTKRNPTGMVLDAMRSLKAAADSVLSAKPGSSSESVPPRGPGVAAELRQLTDLHLDGALTSDEFATAKARLLNPDG